MAAPPVGKEVPVLEGKVLFSLQPGVKSRLWASPGSGGPSLRGEQTEALQVVAWWCGLLSSTPGSNISGDGSDSLSPSSLHSSTESFQTFSFGL